MAIVQHAGSDAFTLVDCLQGSSWGRLSEVTDHFAIDSGLLDRFAELAGPNGALRGEDLAPFLTDWRGTRTGRSPLLLQPRETARMAAIVSLAAKTRTPLVPLGGNSGLVGGGVPDADGRALIVSTRRMTAVRALDPQGNSATVEAGVILQHLHEAAAAADRMFPLSLGAKGSATIGGLISTNAGGTQVLRYGPMRAQVLGLEAVLPDGGVLDQLAPLRKDNSGYDIKQLLIGAEGTLGIVTAASLRLVPAPRDTATALVGLRDPAAALALLARLRGASGDMVDSFELLPRIAVALVTRHVPGTRDPLAKPHDWYALAELTSSRKDGSRKDGALGAIMEDVLAEAMDAGLVADALVAQSERERAELWQLRETIAEAERADGPALKHDIAVPVAAMPRFIEEVGAAIEARWPGTSIFAFGHLGDGNIHFNVRSERTMARETLMGLKNEIAAFVHDAVARFGGSISAEHGIGTQKAAELARLADPGKYAAMRAVKAALDPDGIMNPGKVLV